MVYGPVDGKMTELEYDCRNRLIRAGDITYEYDAEGNRIATNTPEYREEYIYDTVSNLPQVLVIKRYDVKDDESTSEEKYKEEVSNTIICYYGNGLLYEDNEKGTYYHHYNNIGSTILLTNSSGKIVEEYTYGTYGELLSGDISKTKYLYNGQYGIQTDINGLLYMRTRYYNPEIKRFINQDTVLGSITNSQSLNRYAYVQGNPISLVDPFGMSPENGKNAIGHTLLDFMGLIPGIGFVFDAANSAWYVAEGNYTMAALAAFAAIPGLGDAVSAGMLATKGAKAAELCKIIKKLGYAAKVAENVGEIAINATNMYVDYAIKEKEFGVDTVTNLLALGLNGFGIYASVKRYNSVSVDVGKVTDGVEGGNKVADKVSESGTSFVLENVNYAQKTYSNTFSPEGIKKYSSLAGESINTIDDLVNAINTGKIKVKDLPIEYIVRDGNTLILNTRTSQALTQAGIPRSQWVSIDRTGNQLFEELLDGQLSRNKLTSEGISTVRPSGGKKQ